MKQCYEQVKSINDIPRLILIAKQDIDIGTELLYDYGDKTKKSRDAYPWLSKWKKYVLWLEEKKANFLFDAGHQQTAFILENKSYPF